MSPMLGIEANDRKGLRGKIARCTQSAGKICDHGPAPKGQIAGDELLLVFGEPGSRMTW
jgi:hypothetical protein